MKPTYFLRAFYEHSPDALREFAGLAITHLPITLPYGPAFAETWNLLKQSRGWGESRIADYQFAELRNQLQFASEHVPYYRTIFRQLDFCPESMRSPDEISRLPILTREMVQTLGWRLVPDGLGRGNFKYSTTGGTSGRPMGFYITHDASAMEWAFMLTNWGQAGFRSVDKRVVLRGRLPRGRAKGRLWEHDPVNRALYFSSFDMSKSNLDAYVEAMRSYKPDFLHAYPSSATVLANHLERTGQSLPTLRGLLLGSENMYQQQRDYLEATFKRPVFSWYGQSEKTILAGECVGRCGYHLFPEYGYTELIDAAGRPISEPGRTGQLVGTGFINRATVFIRYLTDDQAEWKSGQCVCGRQSKQLANISGRWNQELLVGHSGALISMTALNLHSGVYVRMKQFQLYQDTPGLVTLNIVKTPDYSQSDEKKILRELSAKLDGQVEINVSYVSEIALSPSGKFKFVDQRLKVDYPEFREETSGSSE